MRMLLLFAALALGTLTGCGGSSSTGGGQGTAPPVTPQAGQPGQSGQPPAGGGSGAGAPKGRMPKPQQ
jgi:hypothetical protein